MGNDVVMRKLDDIQAELKFIKEHMVDSDLIVTDDDLESLKEAEQDLHSGKTVRLA
ncbi:hypothetical protein ACFL1B_06175 [Nanoarchaeota archaeon]